MFEVTHDIGMLDIEAEKMWQPARCSLGQIELKIRWSGRCRDGLAQSIVRIWLLCCVVGFDSRVVAVEYKTRSISSIRSKSLANLDQELLDANVPIRCEAAYDDQIWHPVLDFEHPAENGLEISETSSEVP